MSKRSKLTKTEITLGALTSKLDFNIKTPESIKIFDGTQSRELNESEWKAVISNTKMNVWMANYTVESMIEVGRDDENVTFLELYLTMKNFLERIATYEEVQWFEKNLLKDKISFYAENSLPIKVKNLYGSSCIFEGPMESLREEYTENITLNDGTVRTRSVPKGTYIFYLLDEFIDEMEDDDVSDRPEDESNSDS